MKNELIQATAVITATLSKDSTESHVLDNLQRRFVAVYRALELAVEQIQKEDSQRSVG